MTWTCPVCNSTNASAAGQCGFCGSQKPRLRAPRMYAAKRLSLRPLAGLLAVGTVLLAGCASSTGPNGEPAVDYCLHPSPEVPALCLGADLQAHQLVVLGGECCNARWENVTISVSGDSKCQVVTPGSGLVVAGDRISVLPNDPVDCNVKVAYDGTVIGYWSLGPKAEKAAQAALSRTWTGESKPTPTPKPTAEPQPTTDPKATTTQSATETSSTASQNATRGDDK